MVCPITVDIGWLPTRFDVTVGEISITTLPDYDEVVAAVREDEWVERDWIYAPPSRQHVMGRGIRTLPHPARVFGLPKTHRVAHASADGPAHMEFLIWALSFIFGLRLTSTEAGFLDATPIRIGKLNDFVLTPKEQQHAVALSERFWQANTSEPMRAKWWGAAVHALLLGQGPHLLQFERFIYLYGGLDACFKLVRDLKRSEVKRIAHSARIAWMCRQFDMPVPAWADDATGSSAIADIRNPAIHESLFMDAPLGFASHGVGTSANLPLEMEALICRLLVALLGDATGGYVRSPVTTRQKHGWTPPT